jgi:hypothetical protein
MMALHSPHSSEREGLSKMAFASGTGARSVRCAWSRMAAGVAWTLAGGLVLACAATASAQTTEPSTTWTSDAQSPPPQVPEGTQPRAAPAATQQQADPASVQPKAATTAWESLEDPKPLSAPRKRTTASDPAGSLGWEIFGGLAPLLPSALLLVAAFPSPTGHGSSGGGINLPLLSFSVMLLVLGPPTGVAIAGSATGSTAGAGYAYLGAAAGLVLSFPGILIGSIVGYRLSADDEEDTKCTLTPVINRHEIALQWSGRL